ncbi:hypothetical protein [Streptomyces sp. CBMA156]|uniref:hypothetical protein n=1 Tax=Streptomyces sp. CBMA156 TaxID=1930280 RepID=UPI0016619564|nr:hypothetical protein [Streptomyces sp. CBMA156]
MSEAGWAGAAAAGATAADMLKDAGGIPGCGSRRSAWGAGCRFDFEDPERR